MQQSGRLTPFQQRVRDMQEESAIEPSHQSKERALVGEESSHGHVPVAALAAD